MLRQSRSPTFNIIAIFFPWQKSQSGVDRENCSEGVRIVSLFWYYKHPNSTEFELKSCGKAGLKPNTQMRIRTELLTFYGKVK